MGELLSGLVNRWGIMWHLVIVRDRGGEINCPCCPNVHLLLRTSNFFSWLVRGQVKKSDDKVLKVQKNNIFYFRKSCSRHLSWKRQDASNYQSYSNFSNLQRWWSTLSHYYVTILSCLPEMLTCFCDQNLQMMNRLFMKSSF